jgi:uncharacterized protein YcgL (UPF0745 family)
VGDRDGEDGLMEDEVMVSSLSSKLVTMPLEASRKLSFKEVLFVWVEGAEEFQRIPEVFLRDFGKSKSF